MCAVSGAVVKEVLRKSLTTVLFVGLMFGAGSVFRPVMAADAAKEPAPGDVQWRVEASHRSLPPAGQSFYVRLRLKAPELKQAQREPLNLSLVLDRSASMN